jgi:hypothetical protein
MPELSACSELPLVAFGQMVDDACQEVQST